MKVLSKSILLFSILSFTCICSFAATVKHSKDEISLTLIPPSPVTDKIVLDIRAGLKNNSLKQKKVKVTFYLNKESKAAMLFESEVNINSDNPAFVKFRWPTAGKAGKHTIILIVTSGKTKTVKRRNIEILSTGIRSTKRIDGAFLGFYHWSEEEGKYWNKDLKKMTDKQWGEMMDAQHKIGMDIVVIQEVYRNPTQYVNRHTIPQTGYKGIAYYPSKLFPGQFDIAAKDAVEAVLSAADKNGMNVFVGVGLYAWFDFTKGSLDWHIKVADELWKKYGHHPSFYGWYVSEEQFGSLGTEQDRKEIVTFFKEFSSHVKKMAPEKPVMLATNAHGVRGAEETYRQLLPYLDILCPFGFHRMPENDLTGEQAAEKLQALCDEAGSHFWLDLEVFDFAEGNALVPRSINGLVSDLNRFQNFEKVICYQFPGLMNSPEMTIKPGGQNTVRLYNEYKEYFKKLKLKTAK